jgi:hypothetical protein
MVAAIVAHHKLGPGKLSLLEVEHLAEHRIAVCCYCPEPGLLRFGSARAVIDKRCMGPRQRLEEKQCNAQGFSRAHLAEPASCRCLEQQLGIILPSTIKKIYGNGTLGEAPPVSHYSVLA